MLAPESLMVTSAVFGLVVGALAFFVINRILHPYVLSSGFRSFPAMRHMVIVVPELTGYATLRHVEME